MLKVKGDGQMVMHIMARDVLCFSVGIAVDDWRDCQWSGIVADKNHNGTQRMICEMQFYMETRPKFLHDGPANRSLKCERWWWWSKNLLPFYLVASVRQSLSIGKHRIE